jgi:threonine synthase
LEKHIKSHYKELALDFLTAFGIDIDREVLQTAVDRYDAFDERSNPVTL